MSENPYKPFISNVKESVNAVMVVARWAVLSGYDVQIKGMKFAKNYKEWEENADNGFDLIINGKTVNVKKNKRTFTSVDEFICNFKNLSRPILISATHVKTPDVTLILSADYNGGIKIPKEAKKHWGIRRDVFDYRYKTKQDCYDVSKSHVEWVSLK